jgi:type I restriction enzyme S subunit
MGNISYGRVMMDGLKFVDKVDPHFLLTAGDLLFNRTNSRELVGRVAMFRGEDSEPVSFASYLVRLRTNGRAVPEYLNYLLNTPSILDVARATAIPSIGQANLNPSRYGELLICVPPPGEQMQIVASLVVHERALEKLINPLRRQIASLAEYRQALISAAVTGQLDIRAHESAELPA